MPVAQLGERRLCKAEVTGSTPVRSTSFVLRFIPNPVWDRNVEPYNSKESAYSLVRWVSQATFLARLPGVEGVPGASLTRTPRLKQSHQIL